MWRILIFLGFVTALALGAVWLAERPGEVSIVWSGLRIETTVAVAAIGVLALVVAGMLLWAALRFLLGLPTAFSFASRARKRVRGIEAVSRGMVAVGAGDPAAARRHAADARKLIGNEPLALLLNAQAAQLNGDKPAAEAAFKAMLDEPDTRILGLRGLFVEARRRGDQAAARAFADEAIRLSPSLAWANDALLEHHVSTGDWTQARTAVERRASLRLADKTEAKRQRAVLLAAEALSREADDPQGALALASEAAKLAPGLVPAAALAGKLLGASGDLRKAAKVLEAAWREQPHPDLARIYIQLRPGDSAADRLTRAEALQKLRPLDAESAFAVAEAAIAARDYAKGRQALSPLVAAIPTVKTCLLMARIEEGERGDETRAREWLRRSARAPRDNAWVADGLVSESWMPVSPVSGRLDAFAWTLPPVALGAAPAEPEPEPAAPLPPAPPPAIEAAPPQAAEPEVIRPAPPSRPEPEAKPSLVEDVRPIQAAEPSPAVAPIVPPAAPAVTPPPAAPAATTPVVPLTGTIPAATPAPVAEIEPPRLPDDPGPEPAPKPARRASWPFLR